jgi:hypothetical protein
MSDVDDPRTHYHYRVSLRLRHPSMAPQKITEALGIEPGRCWMAGEARKTRTGQPLSGVYPDTYWVADCVSGRWPTELNEAIRDTLKQLVRYRSFFRQLRAEGGTVELFIGWFFENQSGDVLSHEWLALAGDLQIDLSFDVYPPQQPQQEHVVEGPWTA